MPADSETGKIRKSSSAREKKTPAPSAKEDVRQAPVRQLVRFRLDDEEYGIDVHVVDEIRRSAGIVDAINRSAHICGSITVHDQSVDVVDVRSCLGYPARPIDTDARIILVRHNEQTRAMLVDTVSEVIRVGREASKTGRTSYGPVADELIREVFLVDDQPVAILDWSRILDL